MLSFKLRLLHSLFRLEPSTQAQFKNIRHLESEDKLRMSEDLEKHAGRMMATLDDIVNNIDDVDYALSKMPTVAQQDVQFQGFTTHQLA
ncbi:myoglobin, partial [Elysia marginata]